MNWKVVKLGDEFEIILGASPQSKYYNSDGNGMPFYQGKKDFGDLFINPPSVWTSKITKTAVDGDILISVRAPVGSLNIANQEICIGRGLAAIRPSKNTSTLFLYYALLNNSKNIVGKSGATFNSINREHIENFCIPLPPNNEQVRIVKKFNTLFSECAKIREYTEKKLKDLDSLKTAVIRDELD